VHEQAVARRQRREQVFRAPCQLESGGAGQPLPESTGKRRAQVGPAQLHAVDARAHEHRFELPSHGLDFRELRHAIRISRPLQL
jgi:hypothetical protein